MSATTGWKRRECGELEKRIGEKLYVCGKWQYGEWRVFIEHNDGFDEYLSPDYPTLSAAKRAAHEHAEAGHA